MLVLLASLATAGEPVGLMLRPSPGAEARALAQTRADLLQWLVHDNQKALDEQLVPRPAPAVLDTDAVSLGGGVWLVSAWVEPESPHHPRVSWEGPDLILLLEPGQAELLPVQPAPTLEQLLAGEAEALSQGAPSTSLSALGGPAWSLRLAPDELDPLTGDWTPNLRAGDRELLIRDDSLSGIDRQRRALTESKDPYVQAAAAFRLGQAHQALGLHREAAYYFDRVVEQPVAWPVSTVALERAHAALIVGRAGDARDRCREAAEARVRDEQVLECLGMVALHSQDPPPGPTGRALAQSTARPGALLLAGQLLMVDGRPSEARPLLEAAAEGLPDGLLRDRAQASLGDACFQLHDGDCARRAWAEVAVGELEELVWLRKRMLLLVQDGPRSWAAGIPDLHDFMEREGAVAAEALYLLSQVTAELGDLDQSVELLVRLVDEHPGRIEGSDVAARLWRRLSERVLQLHRGGRRVELLALWRERWRRPLVDEVQDTEVIEIVGISYRDLGMFEEALEVQRQLFEIQSRQDRIQPEALVDLAELYHRTGRHEDARRTLDFARREGLPAERVGQALLLEGEVLLGLDEPGAALAAWRRAAQLSATRDEAAARMALYDGAHGRCDRAVPALRSLTQREPQPPSLQDGEGHLLLASCLRDQGRHEEASTAAREAAGRSSDELSRRYGTWLAAEGAREAGVEDELLDQALDGDDDLWAALGREGQAQADFQAALDERRQR